MSSSEVIVESKIFLTFIEENELSIDGYLNSSIICITYKELERFILKSPKYHNITYLRTILWIHQ